MQNRIRTLLSTTLLAFGLSSPALAQQAPPTQAPVPNAASTTHYTDAQLQNFINASRQVATISQEYAPKIEASSDPTAREQMFQEADGKMVAAVEREGLSVQEFNAINHQLPQDPQLEERVNNLLQ